jgi:ketosteroid isomerase-like protein
LSTSDIARRYFAALAAHDLDEATACWKPGAIDVRAQLERAAEAP